VQNRVNPVAQHRATGFPLLHKRFHDAPRNRGEGLDVGAAQQIKNLLSTRSIIFP
jgi:hypothetical protein